MGTALLLDRPHPADTPTPSAGIRWRQAIWLGLVFASAKVLLQVVVNLIGQHSGYGPFRDELYYLVCGRQLAWGYVDQQPIVAVQARLTELLFGFHNLALLGLFSALAGGGAVLLTGLMTASLGGDALAQALAMAGVLAAPEYIGIDSFLSMNSFEPLFWMGCMLAMLQIARGGPEKRLAAWWVFFGVSGGLALENKLSAVFFLACLLGGLLLTSQRRLLFNRWAAVGAALIVLIELPNFIWQLTHGFPTLVWLNAVAHSNKDVRLPPVHFVLNQLLILNPFSFLLWGSGVAWLLAGRSARGVRFAGVMFCLFLPLMLLLHAKDYYVVPIYPVLFAAGAVAWRVWFGERKRVFAAYAIALPLSTGIFLPIIVPLQPPQDYNAYAHYLPFRPSSEENHPMGPLPQFFADRFGWTQFAEKTTAIYNSLSPEERSQACIWGDNYGDASAINVLAPGLPFAISGHQNYYYWGPHGCTGKVMIILGSDGVGLAQKFQSCEVKGEMDDPYAMPEEQRNIYVCRGLKMDIEKNWAKLKLWY